MSSQGAMAFVNSPSGVDLTISTHQAQTELVARRPSLIWQVHAWWIFLHNDTRHRIPRTTEDDS
jgi:hypothetical protein